MAWRPNYVDGGEAGLIQNGWIDDAGNVTFSDPTPALPAGVQTYTQDFGGGNEGMGNTIQSLKIDGTPIDQFTTQMSGTAANGMPGGLTLNPFTGQQEKAYFATINGRVEILPESIAKRLDPNAREYSQTQDGGYGGLGGLIDRYSPQLMALGMGAGVGALANAGVGVGATGAATSGGTGGMGILDEMYGGMGGNFAADLGGPGTGILDEFYGGTGGTFGSDLGGPGTGLLDEMYGGTKGTFSPSTLNSIATKVAEQVGPSAAKSLMSKLLSGEMSSDDWLSMIGKIAPAALGMYASSQQANKLSDLANKYFDVGAPSRARYEASFQPGFSMANEPGYMDAMNLATKSFLNKASVQGNPADSPNAWNQTLKDINSTFTIPALQNYRSVNANTGGLASFTPAAINAQTASVGSDKNFYDALGAGAADVFNPPKKLNLSDFLKQYA
jgi:hypothetical protein